MKSLYLVRHAKSDWAQIGQRDYFRPLADRGHKDAPIMASFLKKLGIQFDLIVSSPAERALTTAQYFAGRMNIPFADIVLEQSIYQADTEDMLNIINCLPDDANTIALFGHNPTISNTASYFAAKRNIEEMPTCSVIKITTQAKSWSDVNSYNSEVKDFWFPKGIS